MNDSIRQFLQAPTFAVAGASRNPSKYGNRVFRALRQSGRVAIPINPEAIAIDGIPAYPSLLTLQNTPEAVSIVTPPEITTLIIREAILAGVRHVWIQPGAEDPQACELARDAGINLIAGGPCLLVFLAREGRTPLN